MREGAERRWGGGRPSVFLGRTAGMAFIALHLFLFAGQAADEGTQVMLGLVLLLSLAAVAVVVAWYSAVRGALLLAVSGLALAVFGAVAADQNQVPVALLLGVPYALCSLLLWFGTARLARA